MYLWENSKLHEPRKRFLGKETQNTKKKGNTEIKMRTFAQTNINVHALIYTHSLYISKLFSYPQLVHVCDNIIEPTLISIRIALFLYPFLHCFFLYLFFVSFHINFFSLFTTYTISLGICWCLRVNAFTFLSTTQNM